MQLKRFSNAGCSAPSRTSRSNREKLRKIVEAGRHAMSARNMQPWQFVVIQNRDTLNEVGALCSTGRFVADSPAAIVVLKDT